MQLYLDLSVLALILITVIEFWIKGFIRSMLGFAKAVLSVILTYHIGPRISSWLEQTFVAERVHTYVHDRFTAMFDQAASSFDLSHVVENLPAWLRAILSTSDVSEVGGDYLHMTDATANELWQMAESFADPIARTISNFIGYALTFLCVMLVLSLVALLLGKFADLPIIRTCDKLLGFLLGVLSAALYASVYTVLMFAVFSMIEGSYASVPFHEAFEQSTLFSWVYDHNLFRLIFGIG